MKILCVDRNSIAEELGIKAGDELLAFDGFPVVDILDYEFYTARGRYVMTVRRGSETTDYDIEAAEDENPGLELDREIPVRSCRNNCIFCFVSQLPKNERLRQTLLVRDDDYRHSFIGGNYVTLTNLTEKDLDRIIRLHLSPLYVSVHTVNPALRAQMLGVRNAPDILSQLTRLHDAGIALHTQIVYCPGYNDDTEETVAALAPVAESLAIVPVGLTRDCNPALRPVTEEDARRTVALVEACQKRLLPRKGTRFVFAADEFYLKAGLPVPPPEAYEDFSQIENGIGLLSAFRRDFDYAIKVYRGEIGEISIATGVSAAPFLRERAAELTARFGGKITVYAVENTFFGPTVTVAGLVVGRDILSQLAGKPLGGRLLLPRVMLREFHDVFLDGTTVAELSGGLGVKVQISPADGEGFVRAVLGVKEERNEL